MSAATARSTRPAVRPAARPTARSAAYLRLVATRRSSAARAPFVAVVVAILAVGLLLLLLLNTVLAQDAFRLHALQVQGRQLADQEQGLQRDVERMQSPNSLVDRAQAMGLVPAGPPVFLTLPDGKVSGVAVPGQAPPPVVVPAKSTPATKPAAAAKTKPTAPAQGTWVVVPGRPR
jgi:hypothetical protein